ncbi:MAG TPA: hypothetical protein VMS37_21265 [Verrucomicrobiae bacterium]|nr:hypothetical protein [Verrucomicrobiae bacterium]
MIPALERVIFAIVLPLDAPNWDTGDLDRAMVHELEHVIWRDWAIHFVARNRPFQPWRTAPTWHRA